MCQWKWKFIVYPFHRLFSPRARPSVRSKFMRFPGEERGSELYSLDGRVPRRQNWVEPIRAGSDFVRRNRSAGILAFLERSSLGGSEANSWDAAGTGPRGYDPRARKNAAVGFLPAVFGGAVLTAASASRKFWRSVTARHRSGLPIGSSRSPGIPESHPDEWIGAMPISVSRSAVSNTDGLPDREAGTPIYAARGAASVQSTRFLERCAGFGLRNDD